jgi:hypothetical protein
MSVVNIGKEAMPAFMAGNGTVGMTPAQLSTMTLEVRKHVVVRASSDNGSTVAVGSAAALAANGFILAAGEQTPPIYVDDLSKIWVVGGDADQEFNWIAN